MAFEKPWKTELIHVKQASTTNECCKASEPMVTADETFLQYPSSEAPDITDKPIIEDCELENVEGITITTSSIELHPVTEEDDTFLQYPSSEVPVITDEPIIEDCELDNVERITNNTSTIMLHPVTEKDDTFSQYSSSEEADITDEHVTEADKTFSSEDWELKSVEGIRISTSSIELHPINKSVKKMGTEFFPALRYVKCDYDYDRNNFEEFIKCNKNLKTIILKKTENLLPIVAEYCTKLRKLDIQLNKAKDDVKSLDTFAHLRELTLRCYQSEKISNISNCLLQCKSLEYLNVQNALGSSQFVKTLSKLPYLRYLVFIDCSNLENLNWLADARHLKVIKVKYDKIIDSPKCNLKKLVKKCVDLSILDIDLTFDKKTCNDLKNRPRDKLRMFIYMEN